MNETFTFFWSGPFSQWHHSKFTVDGITYSHAEQFMMAAKARLFNDNDTLAKILATSNPRDQKKLGREVKNFDADLWDEHKFSVVYIGSYHKFTQNLDLKKELLATGETTMVEASPVDRIWGIGLAEDDIRAGYRNEWRGDNYLGRVLDAVRARIRAEDFAFPTQKTGAGNGLSD